MSKSPESRLRNPVGTHGGASASGGPTPLAADCPFPGLPAYKNALAALTHEPSILAALDSFHRDLGDIFRLPIPGFAPVVLAGAQANHFVLVEQRRQLRWRMDGDPVGHLLRNGLLMQDGAAHDSLRGIIQPALHRERVTGYSETFVRHTDELTAGWDDSPRDMLVEMRRLALLVLVETLFGVDIGPHLNELWRPLLRTLDYIAPGPWLVWPGVPRPGYAEACRELDQFLYRLIAARRSAPARRPDLLDELCSALGADDELIRDQVMTLLIAGHDTSTALLAWTLYLLGKHPAAMAQARGEVDAIVGSGVPSAEQVGQLSYLDRVVKESLRLYPPIHLGNRRAATALEFRGYKIPAGTRVLYSIYLSHRDPRYWHAPDRFNPERFAPERGGGPPPFAYLPFGGGPRFCIGAAFAQLEAKLILARLLQQFDLQLVSTRVRPHMGATLEPRPGVILRAHRRTRPAPGRSTRPDQ